MRILKLEKSVFFNPEIQELLRKESDKRAVGELTSEKPKERVEAAERLLKVVKDDALIKELNLVAAVAKKESFLGRIAKEEAKIDNMPKEKVVKYEKQIRDYIAAKRKTAEEIENLAKQRTMSNSELQQRLKRVLA